MTQAEGGGARGARARVTVCEASSSSSRSRGCCLLVVLCGLCSSPPSEHNKSRGVDEQHLFPSSSFSLSHLPLCFWRGLRGAGGGGHYDTYPWRRGWREGRSGGGRRAFRGGGGREKRETSRSENKDRRKDNGQNEKNEKK